MRLRRIAASLALVASVSGVAAPPERDVEVIPGWSASIPANWVVVNLASVDRRDEEWQRIARQVERQPKLAELILSGKGAVAVRVSDDRSKPSGDVLTFMLRDDVDLAFTEPNRVRLCERFRAQAGPAMKSHDCEVTDRHGAQVFRTTLAGAGGQPWSNFAMARARGTAVLYAIGHFRSDSVQNDAGLAGEVRAIVASLRN